MSVQDRYQRSTKDERAADFRRVSVARDLQRFTAARTIDRCSRAYGAGDRSAFVVDVVTTWMSCEANS